MRWFDTLGYHTRFGGVKVREDDCSYVWKVEENRCEWVKNTVDCKSDSLIAYTENLFCSFPSSLFYLGLILNIIWLLYLFLLLASASDNFFCPNLAIISQVLRLSESVAGVTILAFGNGAPDIFTSLVATGEDEQMIMFTELLGAGIYVTSIIAGTIVFTKPFRLVPFNYMRVVIFYIIGIVWIAITTQDYHIHLWEALSYIFIYIVFIFVVVFYRENMGPPNLKKLFFPNAADSERGSKRDGYRHRSRAHDASPKVDVAIAEELNIAKNEEMKRELQQRKESSKRPTTLYKEFLYDINPIGSEDWKESNIMVKIILIIRAPFMFVFQLFIPVVNEASENKGWSKLLNCFQVGVTPVIAMAIILQRPKTLLWVVYPVVGVVSLVVAVVMLRTTKVGVPPKFHNALAFFGFTVGMLVVYLVAREVMSLLQCVGYATGMSDAILGITLLAWGNSVGDLVSNILIAKRGFPEMGFSACFGGPLFNTLVGLGLTYGTAAAKTASFDLKIRTSEMAPGCITFLLCSLFISIFYLSVTGFVTRRSYAKILYTFYFFFLLLMLLSEFGIIHPLGSDLRP